MDRPSLPVPPHPASAVDASANLSAGVRPADTARALPRLPPRVLSFYLLVIGVGMLNTLSFAPTPHGGWLELLLLGILFALFGRARSWRQAALTGGAFGFGNFVTGIWWLYVSMHDNGGMAAALAIAALVLLSLGLALYPALAGALWWRVARHGTAGEGPPRALDGRAALSFAAAWTLGNWVRGTFLTGFPWLATGYPQVDGPLSHYAPIVGVYGVGALAALASACAVLALQWLGHRTAGRQRNAAAMALTATLAILLGGAAAKRVQWTVPSGVPLSVRLLQGNIPEDIKFAEAGIDHAIDLYGKLITAKPADLIITPETGIPVFLQQVPDDWARMVRNFVDQSGSALVFGAMGAQATDQGWDHFTNSLFGVTPGIDKLYRYDKSHLVPFGEFVPTGFHWFVALMYMPMGDFDRGAPVQPPFFVHGQPISFDICYEDVFGEEIARSLRDQKVPATILVNATNLGWFGDTIALPQHLQMARMRALETGRPLLSATNTGPTAAIDANGRIEAQLPTMSVGTLAVVVQGRSGLTPYIRWGNTPVLLAVLAMLAGCLLPRRRAV